MCFMSYVLKSAALNTSKRVPALPTNPKGSCKLPEGFYYYYYFFFSGGKLVSAAYGPFLRTKIRPKCEPFLFVSTLHTQIRKQSIILSLML